MAALELLEAPKGPVLKDFTEEAPAAMVYGGPPACPVDFHPHTEPISEMDQLLAVFKDEFSQMRSWYDLAKGKRGRTTAITSDAGVERPIDTITRFLRKGSITGGGDEISRGTVLRLAVEDLKAYYFEAVSIQPGQPGDSKSLANWFWGQTVAAKVIGKIREICKESHDDSLKRTTLALIPKSQLHRFE